MAIDYEKLLRRLDPNLAYTGKGLQDAWGIKTTDRSHRINMLMQKGMLKRHGNSPQAYTYQAIYKTPTIGAVTTESTGNGVIYAKLRKEAGLPEQPTTLDDLIQAASKLGTEHKIMKAALLKAKADIEKALEVIT